MSGLNENVRFLNEIFYLLFWDVIHLKYPDSRIKKKAFSIYVWGGNNIAWSRWEQFFKRSFAMATLNRYNLNLCIVGFLMNIRQISRNSAPWKDAQTPVYNITYFIVRSNGQADGVVYKNFVTLYIVRRFLIKISTCLWKLNFTLKI